MPTTIQYLKDLISIESVSRNEKKITNHLEALLKNFSGEYYRHKRVLVWKSPNQDPNKKTIGIACHTDTVPFVEKNWKVTSPCTPLEKDGKIYGRGGCDMKAGGAIMLRYLEDYFGENPIKNPEDFSYNLTFIFYDMEEEGMPNGLTDLFDANLMPHMDLVVIPEPTNGKLNNGVFGLVDWEISATGKAIHNSKEYLGENAIYKLLPVLEKAKNFPRNKIGGVSEAISVNCIQGGIASNVVAEEASCRLDYRFDPSLTPAEVTKKFQDLQDQDLKFEVKDFLPGGINPIDSNEILQKFAQFIGEENCYIDALWTDVGQLTSQGICSINFGPGRIEQAHTSDEWVEIDKIKFVEEKLEEFLTK